MDIKDAWPKTAVFYKWSVRCIQAASPSSICYPQIFGTTLIALCRKCSSRGKSFNKAD